MDSRQPDWNPRADTPRRPALKCRSARRAVKGGLGRGAARVYHPADTAVRRQTRSRRESPQ